MAASIAPARPEDTEAIATLLAEIERYYGATTDASLPEWTTQVAALLFRPQPPAHVLLAREDSQVVGLASYSFLWPAAGVTHSLYLKELFVVEHARRLGVGRALMAELYRIAAEEGCSRVEWTADTDNPTALQFYAGLGVQPDPTKQHYRVQVTAADQPSNKSQARHDDLHDHPR